MFNKYLTKITLCVVLTVISAIAASAQTISKSEAFSEFNSIEANESFSIVLKDSAEYIVDWKVNKDLADFVEVFVAGKVLHLSYNRKALPKELKKQYRGKEAPAQVFDVIVYAPKVSKIALSDKVTMKYSGKGISNDEFTLNLTGSSRLDNFNLASKKVNINLSKSSSASLVLKSDDIIASTSNSSALTMEFDAQTITFTSNGSSKIDAKGAANGLSSNSQTTSSINLKGRAERLDVQSTGFSKQDLSELEAKKVYTHINGSSDVIVNPIEVLSVEIKGAKLRFMNDPIIEIVSINNGSLLHYEK